MCVTICGIFRPNSGEIYRKVGRADCGTAFSNTFQRSPPRVFSSLPQFHASCLISIVTHKTIYTHIHIRQNFYAAGNSTVFQAIKKILVLFFSQAKIFLAYFLATLQHPLKSLSFLFQHYLQRHFFKDMRSQRVRFYNFKHLKIKITEKII